MAQPKARTAIYNDTAFNQGQPGNTEIIRRSIRILVGGSKCSTIPSLFSPEPDLIPGAPQLLRRFYEPLVLLHVLDRSRGERIPRCTSNADCEIDELRRSFIDSIAYICDYEKGRDTVTAAALQREPVGVTVWLAANTHVKERTVCFLQGILDGLAVVSVSSQALTEEPLAARIIDYNKKRLRVYRTFVKQPLSKCLAILRKGQDL